MLQLRPTCEHCNTALPPESADARICSFECTFCAACVEHVLKHDICPNCGGGFMPRPVRPARKHKGEAYLEKYPATTTITYKPVDLEAYASLVATIGDLPPNQR